MRTKQLKIGSEEKTAVLVAGGPGFKIYSVSGFDGWVLAVGKKVVPIAQKSLEFQIVAKYATLRYQPLEQQEKIKQLFNAFLEQLRAAQ